MVFLTQYTAIMLNLLSVAWVAQWVEHVNLHTYILKLCVVRSNPARDFIIVTIENTFVFIFFNFFLLLQHCFSILINLISLMAITFSGKIRNTVLQLSPVTSSVFKI